MSEIQLDQAAINARRNPLTPNQQKRVKREQKKHEEFLAVSKPNLIYRWFWRDGDNMEHTTYIGKSHDPIGRFAKHRSNIALDIDQSRKYVEARHLRDRGVELHMEIIDPGCEHTENWWQHFFEELGCQLWNAQAGIDHNRSRVPGIKVQAISGPVTYCDTFKQLMGITTPSHTVPAPQRPECPDTEG